MGQGSADLPTLDLGPKFVSLRVVTTDPEALSGRGQVYVKSGDLWFRQSIEEGGSIITIGGLSPAERKEVLDILSEDPQSWQRSVKGTRGNFPPPVSPADEDRWLIGPAGWDGGTHPNEIAQWNDTTVRWEYSGPIEGWITFDEGAQIYRRYDGSIWIACMVGLWVSDGTDAELVDGANLDMKGALIKGLDEITGSTGGHRLLIFSGATLGDELYLSESATSPAGTLYTGGQITELIQAGGRWMVRFDPGGPIVTCLELEAGTKKLRVSFGINMLSTLIENLATPVADTDAATKGYVDQVAQGLEWKESVLSRYDPTGGLPVGPNPDDRYISTATANGWNDESIYTYDLPTTSWIESIPNEGWATVVEDENTAYVYISGTGWVKLASILNHNDTANIQGGSSSERYHLTATEENELTGGGSTTLHNHPAAAPANHASTHEDTGGDEINVGGLSGLLADDQHIIDAEAVSAMGAKGDANPLNHDRYTDGDADARVAAGISTHAAIPAAHHAKYTDPEAVTAMGVKGDSNPLNHDRPVQATESALGIAELATQTETDTGTDDLRMVTPLKVRAAIEVLNNVSSPAVLAGNQNDWNPTGLSTAHVIRADPGAGDREVTGIVAQQAGRKIYFLNIGTSKNLKLKNEDALSVAANHFALKADLTLEKGESVILWYDGTSSRYRIVGANI